MAFLTWNVLLCLLVNIVNDHVVSNWVYDSLIIIVKEVALNITFETKQHSINTF